MPSVISFACARKPHALVSSILHVKHIDTKILNILTIVANNESDGGSECVEHTLASGGKRSGLDSVLLIHVVPVLFCVYEIS